MCIRIESCVNASWIIGHSNSIALILCISTVIDAIRDDIALCVDLKNRVRKPKQHDRPAENIFHDIYL